MTVEFLGTVAAVVVGAAFVTAGVFKLIDGPGWPKVTRELFMTGLRSDRDANMPVRVRSGNSDKLHKGFSGGPAAGLLR